ncbi:hypothetical protein A5630_23055 [Mycolicibacterium mucogenicum]|uniref:Tape measure protein n=1 Tax=Mycolicibacterium mucogenicum TaxID=56689 RepID=A0A1A3GZ54_MYCMU|nr:hypothetical protein [Mycolicibacterium mucogenicum]OBJ41322.1 hypothetical protein A5630_23055 [Mycolicibacterium mucogenicum]
MAGEVGQNVGTISIKVTPDTRGFRRRLEEDIHRDMASIDADVPVGADTSRVRPEVERAVQDLPEGRTKVTVDTKSAKAELDAFQKRMLADLKKAGSQLEQHTPLDVNGEVARRVMAAELKSLGEQVKQKIPVDLELASDWRTKVQEQVRELEHDARVQVEMVPKLDRFQERALAEVKTAMANIEGKVPLTPDGEKMRVEARALAASISRSVHAKIPVNLELAAGQRAKIAAEVAGLKALSKSVSVLAGNGVQDGLKAAEGSLTGIGNALSKSPDLSWGAILLMLPLIAPALAVVSGALVTLPGLLAGVLAPLGAVALGFKGIGKALENSGLMTTDKKGKKHPGANLEKVMDSVSGVFESRLTPVFNQLLNLMEPMKVGMSGIANGLSDWAASFVNVIASGPGMAQIQNILSNIGRAFSNAAPGVASFTQGFLTLADQLASRFPNLGTAFSGMMKDFGDWVTQITTKGPDGISQFDSAMSALKGTLGEVGGLLKDMFKQGWADISDPQFGQKMIGFFQELRTLITGTLPSLSNSFQIIADGFKQLQPDIENFLTGIEKITDGISKVSKFSGYLKDLFTDPAGLGIKLANEALGKDGSDKVSASQQAVDRYAKSLSDAGTAAAQSDAALGQFLAGTSNQAQQAQQATSALDVLRGASQQAAQVPQAVAPATNALDTLKQAAAAPIPPLPPIQPPATEPAKAKMSEYQTFVDTVTAQVRGSLQQATSGESLPAPNFEAFKAAWSSIPAFVGEQINAVKAQATSMGESIAAGLNSMTGAITSSFAGLAAAAAPQWEAIKAGAISAFDQIATRAQGLPAQITAALSGMAVAGQQAGAALVNGMANGINANIGSAIVAARNLASQVTAAAKADLGIHSPSRVFRDIGDYTMQGMAEGLENGTGTVLDKLRTVFQAIKDVFGDASGLALNFNFGGGMGGLTDSISAINTGTKQLGKTLGAGGLPGLLGGNTKPGKLSQAEQQQLDMLKMRSQELEIQQQQLRVQQAQTGDKGQKAAIKGQIDQIQLEQEQLKLQQQQLSYAGKYDEAQQGINVNLDEYLKKGMDAGVGVADAGLKQFMGDLGIQGGGALTAGLDWLKGFGQQAFGSVFNFNVQNVDEAIAVKNNQLNKQALQYN